MDADLRGDQHAELHADPSADPHAQAQLAEPGSDSADSETEALPAVLAQPFHGSRGTAPGPGGCWAVKADGQPCRAAVLTAEGADFCSAHSGLGVAANPKGFAPSGVRASAESRRRRAELRLVLGTTRLSSPRSALKALATVNAERLAGRAVSAALDPSLPPQQAVDAVLKVIDASDPRTTATAVVTGEIDPSTASLPELLSFCEAQGISLERSSDGSVEPSA